MTTHEGDAPAMPIDEGGSGTVHHGWSKRESAALALRVPDSGSPWMDAMIRRSLRQEFAKAAMQGYLAGRREALSYSGTIEDVTTLVSYLLSKLDEKEKA